MRYRYAFRLFRCGAAIVATFLLASCGEEELTPNLEHCGDILGFTWLNEPVTVKGIELHQVTASEPLPGLTADMQPRWIVLSYQVGADSKRQVARCLAITHPISRILGFQSAEDKPLGDRTKAWTELEMAAAERVRAINVSWDAPGFEKRPASLIRIYQPPRDR